MQALSDVLAMLNMQVEVYHNAKVCGQWTIREHSLGTTCFHIVTQGRCSLSVPGHLECELNAGDLLIFPSELAHSMAAIGEDSSAQAHLPYASAEHRSGTGMLCGKVTFQHPAARQILQALPAVLLIEKAQTDAWLAPLLELISIESYQQSSPSVVLLDRLCESVSYTHLTLPTIYSV